VQKVANFIPDGRHIRTSNRASRGDNYYKNCIRIRQTEIEFDMESQMDSWQEQAKEISTAAGILAGGDGSARKKKGVINGALYGWGVYGMSGTGEPTQKPTVEHWQNKKAGDMQILCSGGRVAQ
jgi:hypothetical protein